jgi:hypothetical protein
MGDESGTPSRPPPWLTRAHAAVSNGVSVPDPSERTLWDLDTAAQ